MRRADVKCVRVKINRNHVPGTREGSTNFFHPVNKTVNTGKTLPYVRGVYGFQTPETPDTPSIQYFFYMVL